MKFFDSEFHGPLNIGSEEQVSINEMIKTIEEISNYKVVNKYNINKPVGVKGRSSNNELIERQLKWKPKYRLKDGLLPTYLWIEKCLIDKNNSNLIYTKS